MFSLFFFPYQDLKRFFLLIFLRNINEKTCKSQIRIKLKLKLIQKNLFPHTKHVL